MVLVCLREHGLLHHSTYYIRLGLGAQLDRLSSGWNSSNNFSHTVRSFEGYPEEIHSHFARNLEEF